MGIEITIDGVVYAPKNETAEKLDGMDYQIIRGDRSGVFAGYVSTVDGQRTVVKKARRLWYWDGAASLSQLAKDGTSKPSKCKFPCEVESIEVLDTIERLSVTEKARKSIAGVAIWGA